MMDDPAGGKPSVRIGGGDALQNLLRAAGSVPGPRPVETWDPPYCGDIGLAILADGTWEYQGSAIARPAMVKLFASILRKDADGRTYLVTPAEKVDCKVADAHFLAVELAVSGAGERQILTFRTNADDVVTAGAGHPLRFQRQIGSGGLKPYIRVRGRLEALVTRAIYLDLVELAVSNGEGDVIGVWSDGVWWPLADRPAY